MGKPRHKEYHRRCRRCLEIYPTTHKFSDVCNDCNNQPPLRKMALLNGLRDTSGIAIS